MRKSLFIVSLTALCLSLSSSVHAQLFQNSNSDCEEVPIISTRTGVSVSCKYYNANATDFPYSGVDFDGNAYPDCVVGAATTGIAPDTTPQASVLTNVGAAGTCGSQFDTPADNFNLTGLVPVVTSIGLGSTVAGPIANPYNTSPVATSDFAIPLLGLVVTEDLFATAPNTGTGFGASPITSDDVQWDSTLFDNSFASSGSDKTAALLDCDADGDLDAVMAVGNITTDFFGVNLLLNNGTGLQAASAQALTDVAYSSGSAVLAVGDFNNDGNDDVVMAMDEAGSSFVEICTNDGACGFTCQPTSQVALDVELGTSPISPSSIAAGDFNGDDNVDAVITTPGLSSDVGSVAFLFGSGSATFSSSRLVAYAPAVGGTSKVVATGCFDNDNNPDVAVTYGVQTDNAVGVFTGITAATQTSTTLTFNETVALLWGIDTADFDAAGGDDIMMVANDVANTANPRQAFIFMNTVETIVADAGADVLASSSTTQLTGTCATSPADANAVFAPTWTIVSPATGGTLTNANTLTPTLTTTTDEAYTVRLTCRTRCDDTGTDLVVVTPNTTDFLEGSGLNGCSLGNAGSLSSMLGYLSVLGSLLGMYVIRRKKN